MATARWSPTSGDDPIVRNIAVPKRASSLMHWIHAAKEKLPDVPLGDITNFHTCETDPDWIRIKWNGPLGGELYIDRTTRRVI